MLRYQNIWNEIKKSQCATITVHKDIAPTVIQGVKRIKSGENVTRSGVGLVPFSKLVIKKEVLSDTRGLLKITFSLLYDIRI